MQAPHLSAGNVPFNRNPKLTEGAVNNVVPLTLTQVRLSTRRIHTASASNVTDNHDPLSLISFRAEAIAYPFARRLSRCGFERHAQRVGVGDREVELLEANDVSIAIFHEHDFVARFFADVLLRSIREPDRERLAFSVVEHLQFGHILTPSLIASVG